MLPESTERLRFRRMTMSDLNDVTAMLRDFDPMRGDRPPSNRDDAVRWVEWQERNYAEHGFGMWVLETHDGDFIGDCDEPDRRDYLGQLLRRNVEIEDVAGVVSIE